MSTEHSMDISNVAWIDVHVHQHTGQRARQNETQFADAARLFHSEHRPEPLADLYGRLGGMAVIFDVDAETRTGLAIANEEIAATVQQSSGRLLGFGSVDPWKGTVALQEVERCHALGLKGMKFQPITQAFHVNDRRFYPLWDLCQDLGMVVTIHEGTTGIGSGTPGGRGLHLKYARPIPDLDDIAGDFPGLTVIAAHPGWPWHTELLAVARHKSNVFIDLSGWAPRYWPADTVQYMRSVMPEKFLFGSDYPLLTPERWLQEFAQIEVKEAVREQVLKENAVAVLGLR